MNRTDRDGAQLRLERLASAFPRLRHIWADMGYRGRAVEWIKAQLGWTVEIVKRPSKWGPHPIDVEPPPMPKWTTLPRRRVVERTFGVDRPLPADEQRLRVPDRDERGVHLRGDGSADAQKAVAGSDMNEMKRAFQTPSIAQPF